eukprot:scaffold938_cov334-Pavlova_lutheri.AAC.64
MPTVPFSATGWGLQSTISLYNCETFLGFWHYHRRHASPFASSFNPFESVDVPAHTFFSSMALCYDGFRCNGLLYMAVEVGAMLVSLHKPWLGRQRTTSGPKWLTTLN